MILSVMDSDGSAWENIVTRILQTNGPKICYRPRTHNKKGNYVKS